MNAVDSTNTVEEQEAGFNIAELINETGLAVLQNPFLVKIIEAAPSPKAADNHMRELGWSNDLARRVRNGVRLYQKCDSMDRTFWTNGITSGGPRLADRIFDFGHFEERLKFPERRFLQESAFKLGSETVLNSGPFFLREIAQGYPNSSQPKVTSVDCDGPDGHAPCGLDNVLGLFDRDPMPDFGYSGALRFGAKFEDTLVAITFPERKSAVFFSIGTSPGEIHLRSKNFILEPGRHGVDPTFPALYKYLEIEKHFDLPNVGFVEELVRVFQRRDCHPRTTNRFRNEWLTYERKIGLSDYLTAVLSLKFRLFPGGTRLFRDDTEPPIQYRMRSKDIRGLAEDVGVRIKPEHFPIQEAGVVQKSFLELASQIFTRPQSAILLEDVVGESLALNPPTELVQLFKN